MVGDRIHFSSLFSSLQGKEKHGQITMENGVRVFVCIPVNCDIVFDMIMNFDEDPISLTKDYGRSRRFPIDCNQWLCVAETSNVLQPHLQAQPLTLKN